MAEPPKLLQKALEYFQAGRGAEAQSLLRQVLRISPDHPDALHLMGLIAHQAGQNAVAVDLIRRAIGVNPSNPVYFINMGNAFQDIGKPDEAAACYRGAIALKADYAEAHNNLGNALRDQGRLSEAMESYRAAISFKADYAYAHNNLANALRDRGRLGEAVDSYRRALSFKPDYASAHNNLANALRDQGHLEEAVERYRKALSYNPNFVDAHNNLGNALGEQGHFEEAVACYRKAIALKPAFPVTHFNLGNTFRGQGKPDEALESYRTAISLKPDYAEAHFNLGLTLADQGRPDEAIRSYRNSIGFRPGYAEAHLNLGSVLQGQARTDEALASYRDAIAHKPDSAEAYNNIGILLIDRGELDGAMESFHRALSIKPDNAVAHSGLGNALQHQGRLDEALARYRKALSCKPDYAHAYAYSNLLFAHAYHCMGDAAAYLALARDWEQACVPEADRLAARRRSFRRAPLSGRRLRVGYVSADFRRHAVSYFVERLFAQHDRAKIELFAYSAHVCQDAVTARLQGLAEHWVHVAGKSDVAVRDRIEADQIDVLIDLSGHTAGNRLGVFARRAAPVQAHYLGYFASTGLSEMDYWISDDILTPAATDAQFSERIWRLPRVWVSYEGTADAPVPAWRPAEDGAVWLGSFNNLGKLTPATLALWAQVLHALPQGRLLLKTRDLADPGCRQRILEGFAALGIAGARIELQSSNATPAWSEHMAYYNRLDIALDPVGAAGGGSTTCDALWMAVPTVALVGDRMASRMTASMLHAIGHPEWIAQTRAEYIDKIVALARDVDRRQVLRTGQRAKMTASPLCDFQGLASNLEQAYVAMFESWLANRNEPASIAAWNTR